MAFRLQKELVSLRFRKLDDLVFDRRAISRAARRDRAAVHRGLSDVVLDDLLPFGLEVCDPTGHLFGMTRRRCVATLRAPEMGPRIIELLDLAFLDFQDREINGSSVDSWWRTGLETRHCQACLLQLLSKVSTRSLPRSTTGDLCSRSDVDSTA